jgi:Zn-dependent protease with chaperone function
MSQFYPQGPAAVPANLAAPTAQYRRHAWIAMGMLALFVLLYLALAGWFAWKAYTMLGAALGGGRNLFFCLAIGLPAAFLAVFMLKALFFVKRGQHSEDYEVTPQQQPRLFEFLHRLADEAGAPRPHRVYLSPRVNAAVFYDLSVLNLLLPSRKNLEIGLGLVNVLTLGELKAVLAHEFGHFAQRSMAVGRWVYIAQQIADHIVSRRDALDRFLQGLSRVDFRVAWIGWVLRLVIWSIRSLLEQLFRGVMLAQRALSREMEMQADLVAVSLTGSDALIHALHRAGSADDAWDRTLGFANAQLGKGHLIGDLFAVQTRMLKHLRRLFGDAEYGLPPPLPSSGVATHRVFRAELAQPPRMWLTHPLNHEREENAKRVYLAAPHDERSAWDLFDDATGLRREISLRMITERQSEPVPIEQTLQALDADFALESLQPRYRGLYLGRSVVRGAERAEQLVDRGAGATPEDLDALYPESISAQLEQRRQLQREIAMLESLRDGRATATGGVIRHRERDLRRNALPETIATLKLELDHLEQTLAAQDRRCRSVHRAAAAQLGQGWDAYLDGLLQALHFAEHAGADLRDAQRALGNAYAVVTADGKVSASERFRLVKASEALYAPLAQVYRSAADVALDSTLQQRLGLANWSDALEEFKLAAPNQENLGKWLSVIDGWVNVACEALSRLRGAALDQAPAPSRVPAAYPVLLSGRERPLQTRLDWWDRFQTADGVVPGIARVAVAGGIVALVVGMGGSVGTASLAIYNGLAREVRVQIGPLQRAVAPHSSAEVELPPAATKVETRTREGELIESFDISSDAAFEQYVYNVASAAPMVEWTASYGSAAEMPDRPLGVPRWFTTGVDAVFRDPPASIQTKGGGGTRSVLAAISDVSASEVLASLSSPQDQAGVLAAHVRWEPEDSRHLLTWLGAASGAEQGATLLQQRLAAHPDEIATLRAQQDLPGELHEQACSEQSRRADAAPDAAGWQYLKLRCQADGADRDAGFVAGHRRWPEDAWFANAAAIVFANGAEWSAAKSAYETVLRRAPSLVDYAALELARVSRIESPGTTLAPELIAQSRALQQLLQRERDPPYRKLQQGDLAAALGEVAGDEESEPRLVRLAAASDGADAALVAKALALHPSQGFDPGTMGASIGLVLRERGDVEDMLAGIDAWRADLGAQLRAFVRSLQAGDAAEAERRLAGLGPTERGQACVLGVVALGERAPAAWRSAAQQLLFGSERPHLR